MKSLKIFENFKEEINRCSRCGLCQGVCPIFELTKNDCTSPKGKCIMLSKILKENRMIPSKLTNRYMEMCTNCGKCFDYCPSKIDIIKINRVYNKTCWGLRIIQQIFLTVLSFIYKNDSQNLKLNENIKIAYVKPYMQKNIPQFLKNYNYTVFDNLNCDLKFILKYPELSKNISEKLAENIKTKTPDFILTNNILCKLELNKFFKSTGKKVIFLGEL